MCGSGYGGSVGPCLAPATVGRSSCLPWIPRAPNAPPSKKVPTFDPGQKIRWRTKGTIVFRCPLCLRHPQLGGGLLFVVCSQRQAVLTPIVLSFRDPCPLRPLVFPIVTASAARNDMTAHARTDGQTGRQPHVYTAPGHKFCTIWHATLAYACACIRRQPSEDARYN